MDQDTPMTDSPIHIADRRELFVDHHLIDQLDGAELKLHEPRPAGPALRFDQPWEGAFSGYASVFRDGDKVRCYYRAWNKPTDHHAAVTCLAESPDGVTFDKPALGLCDVGGTKQNNVILTCAEDMYTHNFGPFIDTRPGVPDDERYKAVTRNYGLVFKRSGQRSDPMGLFAFASADGIHWRKLRDEPVITEGKLDSHNIAFWSEHEGCYVCYLREVAGGDDYTGGTVRSIARCCSEDFVNWSKPELMDMGDTPPEQLYTNATQPYFRAPHIYIAMPGRFFPGRRVLRPEEDEQLGVAMQPGGKDTYGADTADAVFLTSRGGTRYDRTFMEAFVRPGRDRRNWTSRCNYPAGGVIQTAEDELSIYVERFNTTAEKYLERLTLRLDGFASLHAGYAGGTMTSKPLTFTGSSLELNHATSAAGGIRVALHDANDQPIAGFGLDDCDVLRGDELARTVRWNGNADVSKLTGQPVRLRFEMKDADLFAMRFVNPGTP